MQVTVAIQSVFRMVPIGSCIHCIPDCFSTIKQDSVSTFSDLIISGKITISLIFLNASLVSLYLSEVLRILFIKNRKKACASSGRPATKHVFMSK